MYGFHFKRPVLLSLFAAIIIFSLSLFFDIAFARNWPWDQGHDCVEVSSGSWGFYDTDGIWHGNWPTKECCECYQSPVFSKSGNLHLPFADFSIAGRGPLLGIERTYDSDNLSTGLFGHGWTFNFGKHILPITSQQGDDAVVFRSPGGEKHVFLELQDGSYSLQSGFGVDFKLEKRADGSYAATYNDGTVYEYNADGMLTAITDRHQNQLRAEYDPSTGCLNSIEDASGRRLSIYYGANGKIDWIDGPGGRSYSYGYDTGGNLVSVTDPLGNTVHYSYDSMHRLIQVIDANGNVELSVTYDEQNRVASYTEHGETYTFTYYDNHTVKSDSEGNQWACFFNEYGFFEKEIDPAGNVTTRHHNLLTSTSKDYETIGGTEGINLSRSAGATASASSSYPSGNNYTPDKAVDGSLQTVWVSNYTSTEHYFMVSFADPVDVQRIVLAADYYWGLYFYGVTDANLEFSNGYVQSVTLPYSSYDSLEINLPSIQTGVTWVKLNVSLSYPGYIYIPEFEVFSPTSGGVTYHYTNDANGNVTSVTDPLGNVTTYSYDSTFGHIETRTDARGVITKYEYDEDGNLINEYHAYGTSEQTLTTYTYNEYGNRTSVTDANGNTTTYTYDDYGNLLSETDPLGNTTTWTYDDLGNMMTETGPNGNTTTYEYDLLGRLTYVVNALGDTAKYAYDGVGNLIKKTTPGGSTWIHDYDQYDQSIRTVDPLGGEIRRSYDEDGNLVSERDANGKMTYYEYDALGQMVKMIRKVGDTLSTEDSDDVVWTYAYDLSGNRTSVTDPLGYSTTYAYDELNRLLSVTYPDTTQITYTYDGEGNVLSESLPNGDLISYTYDAHGNVTEISDLVSILATFTYDVVGRLLSRADVAGHATSFQYDALGRVTQVIDPAGNAIVYTYDANGNMLSVTDREGNTTTYSYDILGRQTSTTDPSGNVTTIVYNSCENTCGTIGAVIDANAGTTSFEYDGRGRLLREISADGAVEEFVYDAVGNVIAHTDRDGNTTGYSYDDLYRATLADYPGDDDITYTYDKVGRILTASRLAASISYVYNLMGRVSQAEQNGRTISYVYDAQNGQLIVTRPSGRIVTEHYDLRGRLNRIEDSSLGDLIDYTFSNTDQIVSSNYANGVVTAYTYNPNGLITELSHELSGVTIQGYRYTRDAEGNRLLAQALHNPEHSEEYTYDASFRLTQFKRGIISGDYIPSPTTSTNWQLGPLANWITRTRDGIATTYTHNEVNEYTEVDGIPWSYDQRGNLLDDDNYQYSYNTENRLVEVRDKSTGTVRGSYTYGPLGQRIVREADGVSTEYVFDRGRVIEEYSGGSLQKEYIYGIGSDDIISMFGGTTYFYLGNSLGSVVGVTDGSGALVESYKYSAYGEPTILDAGGNEISISTISNPYMFAGIRFDQESSLYYHLYRYNASKVGRFITRDPAREGTNAYLYAGSNPINVVDPLGLWKEIAGKKDVYMAERGDNLKGLAKKISGNDADWVCLWPKELHGSYPKDGGQVTLCDEYDASNLKAKGSSWWGTRISVSGGVLGTIQDISWGFTPYWSSDAAYKAVRSDAGEGKSPISLLLVSGHSCPTCAEISHADGTVPFSGQGLKDYAETFAPAGTNTHNRAKSKKGPLRCWFTLTAKAYGLACHSAGRWAPRFASHALRGKARAYGVVPELNEAILYWQIDDGPWHFTMTSLLRDPSWIPSRP